MSVPTLTQLFTNIANSIRNKQTPYAYANSLISGGSLATTSDTAYWTKDNTNFSLTQNSGYVTLTSNVTSTTSYYRVYSQNLVPTISGSTSNTNKKIYIQITAACPSSTATSHNATGTPCIIARYYSNGTTTEANDYTSISTDGKQGDQWYTNTWYKLSLYLNTYVSSSNYREYFKLYFGFLHPTSGDKVYYKNFFAINLTDACGAGNEPNKAWCDSNLSYSNYMYKLKKPTPTTQIVAANFPTSIDNLGFDFSQSTLNNTNQLAPGVKAFGSNGMLYYGTMPYSNISIGTVTSTSSTSLTFPSTFTPTRCMFWLERSTTSSSATSVPTGRVINGDSGDSSTNKYILCTSSSSASQVIEQSSYISFSFSSSGCTMKSSNTSLASIIVNNSTYPFRYGYILLG